MRRLVTSHSCVLLLITASVVLAGCGGAKTAITAPEVPGEQLTNPDPGSGVDGTFVPYIPPTGNPGSDPIPAFVDPGMTNQNGQNGEQDSGTLDPVYNPSDNGGIDLTIDVQTGGNSGFVIEVGSDGGKTTIFTSTNGGEIPPLFSGETPGPTFDPGTGQVTIPLQPTDPNLKVWLTVTILDGQGQTGESHGILLPPGWTPVDLGQGGGTGAQMF